MGVYEPIPSKAIVHLRASIAVRDNPLAEASTLQLAERLIDVGERGEAKGLVRTAFAGPSRMQKARVAALFNEKWKEADPLLRLLVLVYGIANDPASRTLDAAVEIGLDQQWPAIAIYLGRSSEERKNGTSLGIGRALHMFGFPSHAFRAYRRAGESGISVAKANLASLLRHSGVPAAGLEVLVSHTGPFDAADPAHPFRIRADIESEIHGEALVLADIEERGRRVVGMLSTLANEGLRNHGRAEALRNEYMIGPTRSHCTLVPSFPSRYELEGHGNDLRPLDPDFPFWVMTENLPAAGPPNPYSGADHPATEPALSVFVQLANGEMQGFTYAFHNRDALPKPVTLKPVEPTAAAVLQMP
jgi:hypothetical protein